MADLFDIQNEGEAGRSAPLADRMRPRTLEEFVGQEHLLGEDSLLRRLIARDQLPSLIFWGPPGSGKTTLAHIIARATKSEFLTLSAVIAGKDDIRRVIEQAKLTRRAHDRATILFVDEVHRFNKVQQDAFLPHVEQGTICLIGATTENPSFSVVAPLLSRCKVITLNALSLEDVKRIVRRAAEDEERGFGQIGIDFEEEALNWMAALADGDARRALNLLEMAVMSLPPDAEGRLRVSLEAIKEISQRNQLVYDRAGEEHYNLISAFHKSIRASDVQAALYWLARMLAAGEDPLYIARRLIRISVEDVGLADPNALTVANQAKLAFESLGHPEGELALAEAAAYLATAPKSNSMETAFNDAMKDVQQRGSLPAPLHIRNAPTKLMKDLGYGEGYKYDHDFENHYSGQECLPEELLGREYYRPSKFGFEKEIQKRLDWWKKLKEKK